MIAIRFAKVNTKRDYLYDSGKQQRNSSVYGKKSKSKYLVDEVGDRFIFIFMYIIICIFNFISIT